MSATVTEGTGNGLARLQRAPIINQIDSATLQLIRASIAPRCNDAEIGHFLELCAHYDLDPFAKEVWCAKGKGDNPQLLIMVGRDGLRKIAHRQNLTMQQDVVRADDVYESEFIANAADAKPGEWEAFDCAPFHRVVHKKKGMGDARGAVTGAWCRVRSQSGREAGWFEAPIGEFKPKDGRELQYSPWSSQESVMILAAAERQAVRQATPLGGLLAEGEDARVFDVEADAVELPPETEQLAEPEIAELYAVIESVGWSEAETLLQLAAVGAQDTTDIQTAVRSLRRDQAQALIANVVESAVFTEGLPAEQEQEQDAGETEDES